jgi:hypothetical protein
MQPEQLHLSSFEPEISRDGGIYPKVILKTDNGNEIAYIGYGGGHTIQVKLLGEEKFSRVAHWGIPRGSKTFGAPQTDAAFFKRLTAQGQDVKDVANQFCDVVMKVAGEALDTEKGVEFLADIWQMQHDNPKPEKTDATRSGFSKALGVMSNYQTCAKKATSREQFLALQKESQTRRQNATTGVTTLDTAGISF